MNSMRHCHHVRHIAVALGGFAASVLVVLTGATTAFAYPNPPSGGSGGQVQPPTVHTIVTGGMPGWQIALIALGAAIFAAVLAVTLDRARTARRRLTAPDA